MAGLENVLEIFFGLNGSFKHSSWERPCNVFVLSPFTKCRHMKPQKCLHHEELIKQKAAGL